MRNMNTAIRLGLAISVALGQSPAAVLHPPVRP